MSTLQNSNRKPNGHAHQVDSPPGTAQCPYCGQSISRKEYKEIQTRIEMEERARIAKIEADLKARVAREVAKAQTQAKAAIEKAKKDAARAAQAKLEATVTTRLQAQRDALEKQKAEAVNAEKVKAFEDKSRLTQQLAEMQARLERKTSHELGEPAEIDLFDKLVASFPDDQVVRVAKGVKGPDIILKIDHDGATVGSIIVDSKNHRRWSNTFTVKLRADQLAEGADFAILSTATFPKGTRQLHIQDGVIVADPARVVVLAHLLRRQIVQSHVLKLSGQARTEKAQQLYSFVLSAECADLFDRLKSASDSLIDLEVKEVDAHHGVWRRRGELIRTVQQVHEQFGDAVTRIISRSDTADVEEEVAA